MRARWPQVGDIDELIVKEAHYLNDVLHDFRVRIKKMMELRMKV